MFEIVDDDRGASRHASESFREVSWVLFLDFEAVARLVDRHASSVVPRRGGLITVHELHQTIREIGQELSIDDVRFLPCCLSHRVR